jgi:Stage II sporulation protein
MRNSLPGCHSATKWRNLLLLLFLLPRCVQAQLPAEPATVRIGVFSLFHPQTLTLSADHSITLLLDGSPHILDAHRTATLHATPSGLTVDATSTRALAVPSGTFTLTVPGKLTRVYRGALSVSSRSGVLIPVVTMETELAVASIVAAESAPDTPPEALKAQAIASRSYLLANPHAHAGFDACDTTHCQFLRSPPAAGSPAAIATRATRNTVLTWRAAPDASPRLVAAKYSRSCGGHTRVPPASATAGSYPFYAVRCDFCLRHPELWTRANTPSFSTEHTAGRLFHPTRTLKSMATLRAAAPAMASDCASLVRPISRFAAPLLPPFLRITFPIPHSPRFPELGLVVWLRRLLRQYVVMKDSGIGLGQRRHRRFGVR